MKYRWSAVALIAAALSVFILSASIPQVGATGFLLTTPTPAQQPNYDPQGYLPLLLNPAAPISSGGTPSLSLSPDSPHQTATANSMAAFQVVLQNLGPGLDNFTIAVQDSEDWMWTINVGNPIPLNPGTSAGFTMMVRVPANATAGTVANLVVSATGSHGAVATLSGLTITVVATTPTLVPTIGSPTVTPGPGTVTATPTPTNGTPTATPDGPIGLTLNPNIAHVAVAAGSTPAFTFVLRNFGSTADTFTIAAQNSQVWPSVLTVGNPIPLDPGASMSFSVIVNVPANATIGTVANLSVSATAAGGASATVSGMTITIVGATATPTATPGSGNATATPANGTPTVTPNGTASLALNPNIPHVTAMAGGTASFAFVLQNLGPAANNFTIAAQYDPGWTWTMNLGNPIPLNSGSAVGFIITVNVPAGTPVGTVANLTVSATAGGGASATVSGLTIAVVAATPTPTVTPTPTATPTLTPTPTATPMGQTVNVSLTERLAWYAPGAGPVSYDIVVVEDQSTSMRSCWVGATTCSATPRDRRIDVSNAALRRFVNEVMVVQNNQGSDNRVAYVSFGHLQSGKTIVKVRVPFSATQSQMLSQYGALIGTMANPRVIPDTELTGYSNGAHGLIQAYQMLANNRDVDRYGHPVRQIVVYLTDGVTNVFADSNRMGYANLWTTDPFYCGTGPESVEDAAVQVSCPAPAGSRPKPPVKALIDVAAAGRRVDVTTYAILLGDLGFSAEDILLHQVAPERAAWGQAPATLEARMLAIAAELPGNCLPHQMAEAAPQGAAVTVRNQGGGVVATGITDNTGRVSLTAPPGDYTLEAAHLGVVAPADPLAQPRDYARIASPYGPPPGASMPFAVGQSTLNLAAELSLTSPASAACP